MKTVLITGGSGGIGAAAARLFSEKGYTVFELSRSGSSQNGVTHINTDVTKEEDVAAAIKTVARETGGIDILINNAGMGISGAVEFTQVPDAKKLFEVNLFGTLNCAKAVIPLMRENGGGRIINISSVAGVLPIPYQAFYSCSKAAVNALTLALANEIKRFNIKVCAVMPGDARTGFTASRAKSCEGDALYGGSVSRAVAAMEKDEQNGMTAEYVAKVIYRAATKKHPKPFYTAGGKYRLFVLLAKLLPAGLSNKIVGAIYK